MVVDRSARRCLLCDARFSGRAFVCRDCADRYRREQISTDELRRFYHQVDLVYPDWANTFGNYNPPRALMSYLEGIDRQSRVLEIGAGGGYLLESLSTLGFWRLAGSDITTTSLSEMRRRRGGLTLVGADAESLPFTNHSLDVVISSDVIEHLQNVSAHISEVHRILVPGGRYLLKTPNRLLAQAYYRVRGLYDHHIWHPSMFSPAELRSRLEGYGFEVRFLAVRELTAAQVRKVPSERLRVMARRIPVHWLPLHVQPHLEVVAIKRT